MTRPLSEQDLANLFRAELPPAEMPADLAARLEARVLAEVDRMHQLAAQRENDLTSRIGDEDPSPPSSPVPSPPLAPSGFAGWYSRLRHWPRLVRRTGSLALAGSALAILLLLATMLPQILAPAQPEPVTISPGNERMLAPTAPRTSGVGRLSVREGVVEVSRGDGQQIETVTAPEQTSLLVGDRVDVLSGRAEISFAETASAEVLQGTQLRVLTLSPDAADAHIALFQETGVVRYSVASQINSRERYDVRTPAVRVTAATADFVIELPAVHLANVRVTSGSSSVETASARSTVMMGEMVQVQGDGALVMDAAVLPEQSEQSAAVAESLATAPIALSSETPSALSPRPTQENRAGATTALLPTPTSASQTMVGGTASDAVDRSRSPTVTTTADSRTAPPTQTPTSIGPSARDATPETGINPTATMASSTAPTATATPTPRPIVTASPTRRAVPTATLPGSPQAPTATSTARPAQPTALSPQPTAVMPEIVKQPPTAIEDAIFTQAGESVLIPALANDYDIDQDTLVVIGLSQPENGRTNNQGNGVILYSPAIDFSGRDRFTYRISDGQHTATGTVYVTVQPPNQPPTINPLADRLLREDSTLNVPLIVRDLDQGPQPLSVRVAANNGQLFNEEGLQSAGSGESRSLTLSPIANRFGVATVSVTVSDGAAESTASFQVTVQPENDAPTLSSVDPLQLREDQSGTVAFTVNDEESTPADLSVTAQSSNTTLFPAGALQLSGDGETRTLVLSPAPEASGTAQITLTVGDGDERTTQVFGVQVIAVDDPPVIEPVADQTLAEDSTGTLTIRLADADTPVDALTLKADAENFALFGEEGLQITGSGAERTLRIAPAANAFGSTPITLAANDGTSQGESVFVLTVTPVNDPPQLSALEDQFLREDETLEMPIGLTDADLNLSDLTISARSDNSTLVGEAGLRFSGSDGARVLGITPAAEQSGSARITVRVSDGEAQAEESFLLTVTPVNDPPTLDLPAEITMQEDNSVEIMIRIDDPDHDAGDLQLSVADGDSTLLAEGGLELSGDGNERRLRITPSPDQAGEVEVTVVASDGALQVEQLLRVVVEAVNDPPTIEAIEDQAISAGASHELTISIADPDHAPNALQVQAEAADPDLLGASGISVLGDGGTRTLLIATASEGTGATQITLTVRDGEASAETTFTLTVGP